MKFFLILIINISLGFSEIVELGKVEYTAELHFKDAYIKTDIDCDSKVQDILYFFNSEKKEFRNIVCNAKLLNSFMDEKNFSLSKISYGLVFENFNKIIDNSFKKTIKLNDFDISSGMFNFDLSEDFILGKQELPVLINKTLSKEHIINSDLFSLGNISFSVNIKKGDYILDAFKGYQDLRLIETYTLLINNLSDIQRDIKINGLILDNTKTKISNTYRYKDSSCVNGEFYFFDKELNKESKCNWIEL